MCGGGGVIGTVTQSSWLACAREVVPQDLGRLLGTLNLDWEESVEATRGGRERLPVRHHNQYHVVAAAPDNYFCVKTQNLVDFCELFGHDFFLRMSFG